MDMTTTQNANETEATNETDDVVKPIGLDDVTLTETENETIQLTLADATGHDAAAALCRLQIVEIYAKHFDGVTFDTLDGVIEAPDRMPIGWDQRCADLTGLSKSSARLGRQILQAFGWIEHHGKGSVGVQRDMVTLVSGDNWDTDIALGWRMEVVDGMTADRCKEIKDSQKPDNPETGPEPAAPVTGGSRATLDDLVNQIEALEFDARAELCKRLSTEATVRMISALKDSI